MPVFSRGTPRASVFLQGPPRPAPHAGNLSGPSLWAVFVFFLRRGRDATYATSGCPFGHRSSLQPRALRTAGRRSGTPRLQSIMASSSASVSSAPGRGGRNFFSGVSTFSPFSSVFVFRTGVCGAGSSAGAGSSPRRPRPYKRQRKQTLNEKRTSVKHGEKTASWP